MHAAISSIHRPYFENVKRFYLSVFFWHSIFISPPGRATDGWELDAASLVPLFEDVEGLLRETKSHLSKWSNPARTKWVLETRRTFHLPTRAGHLDWITLYHGHFIVHLRFMHQNYPDLFKTAQAPYSSSIICFKRILKNHKIPSSGLVKIMFPGPAPRGASDVPPYTPTDLISPSAVSAPPYTENATQDPAYSNETVASDPAVANVAPKPRHRSRENCPLSSHPWVLWLLWLYCSALFSVEIVELIR